MRVKRRFSTRWGHPYHLPGACATCRQTRLRPLCFIPSMIPERYMEWPAQSTAEDPPEDRLLFILVYLKTYALQVVQGRLFGMVQSKANRWIHLLLPALLAALRTLGDAPARSLTALAQRLGVAEAAAATLVAPLEA